MMPVWTNQGRAYVAAATIAGTIHVFGGSDGGQVQVPVVFVGR